MNTKICPRCSTPNGIGEQRCRCGHQFRTVFPAPDQTQLLRPAQLAPEKQNWLGPMDATERAVSMGWTVVGAVIFYLLTLSALGMVFSFLLQGPERDGFGNSMLGFYLLLLAGSGAILSFLLMRWRRHFLTFLQPHQQRPASAMFAVLASVAILALILLAFGTARDATNKEKQQELLEGVTLPGTTLPPPAPDPRFQPPGYQPLPPALPLPPGNVGNHYLPPPGWKPTPPPPQWGL